MKQDKKLELYLHIPFCERKCEYCDFLSGPASEEEKEAYVKALQKEISYRSKDTTLYSVPTLFLGGGTPSVLSGAQVQRLMESVQTHFSIEPGAEITIECNPGTLTKEKLSAYKSAGINRISLGLQSARNEELKLLGRIHTFEDFIESYDLVRKAGFTNVNVDLMSALPGQSLPDWEYSLNRVAEIEPEHISAYSLIVEEGTPFYHRFREDDYQRALGALPRHLPTEETERAMYDLTEFFLVSCGYHKYEISNYALPGKECRHNKGYWNRENYLGLGLGSASLVEEERFSNTAGMKDYLSGTFGPLEKECLTQKDQMEEYMFLGLRLTEGVSKMMFEQKFGKPLLEIFGNPIQRLTSQGLLQVHGDRVSLTGEGISVSNYALAQFLL